MTTRDDAEQVIRYADMFAAMGAEPRLRIMQLLLTAHPQGLVVGDIQDELGIPASTLSHHLDKLKNEELVKVRREGTFLWYTANTEALQELLNFLYAECCTRNKAVKPGDLVLVVQASKGSPERKSKPACYGDCRKAIVRFVMLTLRGVKPSTSVEQESGIGALRPESGDTMEVIGN